MKVLKYFFVNVLFCVTILFSGLVNAESETLSASEGRDPVAPFDLVSNICPPEFTFSHFNKFEKWNVCLVNELVSKQEGEKSKEGEEGPLLKCISDMEEGVLRAINPEADVCFMLSIQPGETDIFSAVRDPNKRRILVDLHKNKDEAGCVPGSGNDYVISPGEVYCLIDIPLDEFTEAYSISLIEETANNYFSFERECMKRSENEMRIIEDNYMEYLYFAYYNNPNIELMSGYTTNASRSGEQSSAPNELSSGEGEDDVCPPILARPLIGVTND